MPDNSSLYQTFRVNCTDRVYRVEVFIESGDGRSTVCAGSCHPSRFEDKFKDMLSYPCFKSEFNSAGSSFNGSEVDYLILKLTIVKPVDYEDETKKAVFDMYLREPDRIKEIMKDSMAIGNML